MNSEIEEINKTKLEELEDYRQLTDLQKSILNLHFEEPRLTQEQIGNKLNCHRITVNRFFQSQEFDNLAKEVGKINKTYLISLSLKTIEECLNSKSEQVRLMAAKLVLGDSGVVTEGIKSDNSKKVINIQWKEANASNTVPASTVPEGSPRRPI